jgi:hypothetical protein
MDIVPSVSAKDFLTAVEKPSGPRTSEKVISAIDFPCPKCHQQVKGNKGYYVEHTITRINNYGLPETRLCNGSNNKIKAELRTLVMHGQCGECDTEFDFKLTEEYPGGLKQEGGVLEVPCIVCHGKTTATCEHCGGDLVKKEDVWFHELTEKNECPFGSSTPEDLDEDLDDEFFEAAPKEKPTATPLAGTEKTAPLSMVYVTDGFEIPEYDEQQNPDSTESTTSEDALAQDPEV